MNKKEGKVLYYDKTTRAGVVQETNNGPQYKFTLGSEWNYIEPGNEVYFELDNNTARLLDLIEDEYCDHEFDMDEGGMCLNCGADNWYDHYDEDYDKDR